MRIQSFHIEDHFYGKTERKAIFVHEDVRCPPSYAFFCPVCGRIWAKAEVHNNGVTQLFTTITRVCRDHGKPGDMEIAGSIILEWDRDFNAAIPDAAMVYSELDRHIDYYERNLK